MFLRRCHYRGTLTDGTEFDSSHLGLRKTRSKGNGATAAMMDQLFMLIFLFKLFKELEI